jgi:hypothetical protein
MSAPHPIRPCAEFPNDNAELHAGSRWHLADPMSSVKALLPETPSVPFEAARLPPAPRKGADQQPDAPEAAIAVLEVHALDTTTPPQLEWCPQDLPTHEDPFLVELLPFVEQFERAPLTATFAEETPTQKLQPWTHVAQPLAPLHFELTPLPPQVAEWTQLTTILADYLLSRGHTRASALIGPLLNAELVDLSRLDDSVLEHLQRDGVACLRGTRVVSSPSFRSSAHVLRDELANGGLDSNEAMFWLTDLVGALMGGRDEHSALETSLRELGIAQLLDRAA